MQNQLVNMTVHPITGWKLSLDLVYSKERQVIKTESARKKRNEKKEVKNERV
jgi:hypothetical protein